MSCKWFHCQLSPNVNCHPNSISSKHISRIYQCRYQKKSAISKSISISINAHTRRVQTERSQRREGSPRTWWSCIVVIIIIIYDDVSYMMMYIIYHHLHESIREESPSKDPKGSSKDRSTESPQANVVVRIIMLGGHNHRFV